MKQNIADEALKERFLLQNEYLGDNKPVNRITPLVSVTVATYQHVDYIKQCLEGILMQKTNFPYEIIVGEDGSVDGTQDICKEYAEKYPDKIRLYIRDRKLSQFVAENGEVTRFNGIWNRMSARGKYIAWCEGDDYWIDPLKLQKQVDFLESHPDYSICFHSALLKWEKGEYPDSIFYRVKEREYYGTEIFKRWIVATASVVFRKSVLDSNIYEKVLHEKRFIYGDNPLFLCAAKLGRIYGMKEVMSVYRKHEGGAVFFHDIKRELKTNIHDIAVYEVFGEEYKRVAMNKICKRNIYNYLILTENGRYKYRYLLEDAFRRNWLFSCVYYFYVLLKYNKKLKSCMV